MIYIFTGPICSGKTTKLSEWADKREDIGGILMPVLEGERHMYSIHSDKLVPVEIHDDDSSDEIVKIGKYNFSGKVFEWGNREIHSGFENNNTIIIDEIGPLELNGGGFFATLTSILEDEEKLKEKTLILVVREELLEEVTAHFGITDFQIVYSAADIN